MTTLTDISRRRRRAPLPGQQSGAALIVGLILLMVMTILAVSGINTASTELAIARNNQNYENAFQAAETGLEEALAQRQLSTSGETAVSRTINANDSVSAVIQFQNTTMAPDRAFSLGVGSGVAAYHFTAIANSDSKRDPDTISDRDAAAEHTQSFYVVGPESSAL